MARTLSSSECGKNLSSLANQATTQDWLVASKSIRILPVSQVASARVELIGSFVSFEASTKELFPEPVLSLLLAPA